MNEYWAQLVAGAEAHAEAATRHRPTDPAQLTAEIRRLAGTGLRAIDISTALRLDHAYVVNALHNAAGPI